MADQTKQIISAIVELSPKEVKKSIAQYMKKAAFNRMSDTETTDLLYKWYKQGYNVSPFINAAHYRPGSAEAIKFATVMGTTNYVDTQRAIASVQANPNSKSVWSSIGDFFAKVGPSFVAGSVLGLLLFGKDASGTTNPMPPSTDNTNAGPHWYDGIVSFFAANPLIAWLGTLGVLGLLIWGIVRLTKKKK